MAGIELSAVGKTYPDGTLAVRGVDMNIRDGEFMVLVGPSGCGKSTLLRMIAGLESVTEGTLSIGDRVVNGLPPRDRDLVMVFQNYALYPHMTAAENIGFGLRLQRVPKADRARKVREVAEMLDIVECLDKKPRALSGGQRQRVAMGRAIIRHPSAFLMDEPLSNLDAKLRVQMRAELIQLHSRLGVTTVYVTHDQVEAMTMGDRVAVLRSVGERRRPNLQQVGTPRELYEQPASLFVAGFIGSPSMNFIETSVKIDGGAASFMLGEDRVVIPPEVLSARPGLVNYRRDTIIVGFRPDSLNLRPSPDHPNVTVTGAAELTEYLGSSALINFGKGVDHAAVGQHTDRSAADTDRRGFVAQVDTDTLPQNGDRVEFYIRPDHFHFFDPVEGRALR